MGTLNPAPASFHRYNILVSQGGHAGTQIPFYGCLAPEVEVLRALHPRFGDQDGENPIKLIPGPDGSAKGRPDRSGADADAIVTYLGAKYGAEIVAKLFGAGRSAVLPKRIDLDDYAVASLRPKASVISTSTIEEPPEDGGASDDDDQAE